MSKRTFPVLWQWWSREARCRAEELKCPRVVPYAFIGECREACVTNHDQTPERLVERGGLSPEEMLAVRALFEAVGEGRVLARKERLAFWALPPDESVPRLITALEAWTKIGLQTQKKG